MPTAFEMRRKNEKFAEAARSGKKPTHESRRDRLAKRSPISTTALAAIVFVVCGGIIFEIARFIFL